ncbi:T9SS type A sorting domain-containing protein [candidate division WOR-3 bacterium]|nr:T9SS type A sorting domain-containing protein [candidate division WOR-3 bacterium]
MILLLLGTITVISDTPDSLILLYNAEYTIDTTSGIPHIKLTDGECDLPPGYPEIPYAVYFVRLPEKGGNVEYKVLEKTEENITPPVVKDIFGESEYRTVDYKPSPVKMEVYGKRAKKGRLIINPFIKSGNNVEVRKKILIKIKMKGKWFRERYRTPVKFINKIRGRIVSLHPKAVPEKGGMWIRLKFVDEGVYRIDRSVIEEAGFNPDIVDPEKIEVRSGYRRVFKFNLAFYDSLKELPERLPAIYHVENHNGRFDEGEYILFYGVSLEGFEKNVFKRFPDYNPRPWTDTLMRFYYNPFTDTNVYWLRLDGEPLKMDNIPSGDGDAVTSFQDTLHFEKDSINFSRSGLAWTWGCIVLPSDENTIQKKFHITGLEGSRFTLRTGFYTIISGQTHHVTLRVNDVDTMISCQSPYVFYGERLILESGFNSGLKPGENTLIFSVDADKDEVYFDFFEVIYTRAISDIHNESVWFPDSGDRVIKTDKRKLALGIDDPYNPEKLTYSESKGGYYYDGKRIFLCDSFLRPLEVKIANPVSLWNGGADWLCIAGDMFITQANKLAEWRSKHLKGFPNPEVKVVSISEVYDNFSFGVADPGAIKRFLLYASQNWSPPPSYVLFLGKGTYDYKNHTGLERSENIIPIHTNGADVGIFTLLSRNPTEDVWYVDFDGDTRPEIPIGRVTATTQEEAEKWVDKLIEYEKSEGLWRQKVLILADDEYTSNSSNELLHTRDAENTSSYLPDWLKPEKVYMVLYPFEGNQKPAANRDFMSRLSSGAIIGFFYGHGNISQLTHEKVLSLQDISTLSNWRKCSFFYLATCNAGYFERPGERSIGDYFTLYPDGGSIVSVAATRATYPGSNYALGRTMMQNITSSPAAGDAFVAGLSSYGSTTYTLFGDPATPLFKEFLDTVITAPDTLLGNRVYSMLLPVKLDRTYLIVTEKDIDTTYESPAGGSINFTLSGNEVFRGIFKNTDTIKFTVPFDVKTGWGKVRLYGILRDREVRKTIPVYMRSAEPVESNPPVITVNFEGEELKELSQIPREGTFTIKIQDESGIDIRKPQNVSVFLNGYSHPLYIGDRVEFYTGSYKKGFITLDYSFDAKNGDTVFIDIYGLDNAGNVGRKYMKLVVAPENTVWGLHNYPNPMAEKTTFIFHLLKSTDVELIIFSVTGKPVWKKSINGVAGRNYIDWNGTDMYGRKLGNGVYYYVLKTGNAKKIKKLVIVR